MIGPSNQLRIAPPQHTRLEWLKKLEASGYACHYCGDSLTIHTATKDHKTPTCRGGSDRISNIVPSCLPCNQKKAWRTKAEFLRERDRLFNKPRVIRGIPNLKPSPAVAGISDEPGLLKKLTAERESVSWAWRNPAVQFIKLSDDDVADARAIIKAITGGKP